MKTFRIPEYNLEALTKRLSKMNRRASRLHMPEIVLTETGEDFDILTPRDRAFDAIDMGELGPRYMRIDRKEGETIEEAQARFRRLPRHENAQFVLQRFVLATVTGELPRVNGWAMRATLQHEDGGNILRTVPGYDSDLPLQYRTAFPACEHCSLDRQRKDTYVLEHEDGSWKQVGRNCLADFIRSTDAEAWAEWAEVLAGLHEEVGSYEEGDEGMGSCRGQVYYVAADLLAQVACIVRQDGFCSRTEARNSFDCKQATVDFAMALFDPKFRAQMKPAERERYTSTAADTAKAEESIAWAQALEPNVKQDYLWNIRLVAHKERLTAREAGLAGSIIVAHQRHLEQEVKRAYERQNSLDEHFGTVGQRAEFRLTVIGTREIEGNYGLTTLYRFRDQDGRVATWFASGEGGGLDIGSEYAIVATVKKHDVYQGAKQTVLTRAAVRTNLTALDPCVRGEHDVDSGICVVCGEVLAHHQDADCDVDPDTGMCRDCGTEHAEPCHVCGGRAFHQDDCAEIRREVAA